MLHSISFRRRLIGGLVCIALSAGAFPAPRAVHATPVPSAPPLRTASAQAGGLRMTIYIPVGPYFLGELLMTTVALTNNSGKSITYAGAPVPSPCATALGVFPVAGGSPPYDRLPLFAIPCPNSGSGVLPTGQTLSITQPFLLMASGRLTLSGTVDLVFAPIRQADGSLRGDVGPGPFAGRFPTLALTVAPTAPADPLITLHYANRSVHILAPAAAFTRMIYEDSFGCGGTGTGHYVWIAWRTPILPRPGCASGQSSNWLVLVGSPGYKAVMGTY